MAASIYKNVENDRQYSASTGLKKCEFDALYEVFEKYYMPKQILVVGEKKQSVLQDKRETLFFILYHLKSGVSYQLLGISFGISEGSAISYVRRIKPALKASLKALNCMPANLFKNQEEFDKVFENVEDIFIDCTEIPVERAENKEVQEEFYSGKKNNIRQKP